MALVGIVLSARASTGRPLEAPGGTEGCRDCDAFGVEITNGSNNVDPRYRPETRIMRIILIPSGSKNPFDRIVATTDLSLANDIANNYRSRNPNSIGLILPKSRGCVYDVTAENYDGTSYAVKAWDFCNHSYLVFKGETTGPKVPGFGPPEYHPCYSCTGAVALPDSSAQIGVASLLGHNSSPRSRDGVYGNPTTSTLE